MEKYANDVLIVTYTHSNAFDVVPYYCERLKKHSNYKNIFLTNKQIENESCYIYDDNLPFSTEYFNFLQTINSEFVIFSQEDQILYSDANKQEIHKIIGCLRNSKYCYCRLIRQQETLIEVDKNLYLSDKKFSMQPTIWKTESLKKIMSSIIVDKIFEEPKFDIVMNDYDGLFYYNGEKKKRDVSLR